MGTKGGRRVEGGSGWAVAALQFPLSARNACPPLLIANTAFLSPLQSLHFMFEMRETYNARFNK